MGLYDDQITERIEYDDLAFQKACLKLTDSILGRNDSLRLEDEWSNSQNAVGNILKYYHLSYSPQKNQTDSNHSISEELETVLAPNGIMHRIVSLEGKWYTNAQGPFLGLLKSTNEWVAILPNSISGYKYYNKDTGKKTKITAKNADIFETKAYCFYQAFPQRSMNVADLLHYIINQITPSDIIYILLVFLAATLISMLTPKFTSLLYGMVVNVKSVQLLIAIGVFMLSASAGRIIVNSLKGFVMDRLSRKVTLNVEAAAMIRILSLPTRFFRDYTSGELSVISGNISKFSNILLNTLVSTSLSSLFSLLYIIQIFNYAPALVAPAVLVVVASTVFNIICTFANMNRSKLIIDSKARSSGIGYSLLSGVEKIKLTGSEKRAFAKWAEIYSQEARLEYNPPLFLKVSSVISSAISTTGTIIIYYFTVKNGVSLSEYTAFMSAYGLFQGVFGGLSGIVNQVANIRPSLEVSMPILKSVPEASSDKEILHSLSGDISLDHISFRYNEASPYIYKDFSLKINKGEYVAIVGKTGCGKSTLVRLMLGFEKPEIGAITVDGKNLEKVDLKSMRRHIGTVIQNGKLFQGTVYENITVATPGASMDAAWKAAEISGIKEDIEKMPLGMNTVISEGQGGISGGQKQRLMIARAIVGNPNLLILDEATSALDNITQKKVSNALSSLKCTRIVIAHRLSTIQNCDRIVVIDNGEIIQDGTYDELSREEGFFKELIKRQVTE